MSLETGLAEPEPESSYSTSLFLGFLTGFCDEYMSYITNVSRKVHGTFKKEKKKVCYFFLLWVARRKNFSFTEDPLLLMGLKAIASSSVASVNKN